MPIASVVIDTNVIVSAHLSSFGLAHRIFDLAIDRRLRLFVSTPILEEYELVLRRPKFPILPARVDESLGLIRGCATLVEPTFTLDVSHDEPDNRFLECAEAAAANFLVTGNLRHFPRAWRTTRIVTCRELVETAFSV